MPQSQMTKVEFDIKKGGRIDWEDGRFIDVPPQEDRIHLSVFPNGVYIEVVYYDEPVDGHDPSDRIHLLWHPEGGDQRGVIMNTVDACTIIHGLAKAVGLCLEDGFPILPSS